MTKLRRSAVALLALVWSSLTWSSLTWSSLAFAAQSEAELAVKATYLLKLPPFVAWPSPSDQFAGGAFPICIIGRDPFGPLLDRAAREQTVAGRPVIIRRYAAPDAAIERGIEILNRLARRR